MKIILYIFLASLCLISCDRTQCKDGLDLLPMYGKEIKCKKQIEKDNRFLASCDTQYPSRKEASEDMLRFAWKHYVNGDIDMAMKRFNQAWLLDSLNADIYLGYGEIMLDEKKFDESLIYFNKSIELNPQNAEAYKFSGVAYSSLFDSTSDQKYLDKSIEQIKKSIEINPEKAGTFALLTNIYSQYSQQDSARKYLKITDKMNPDLIKSEVRERILKK
ncbi:hypothetical protein LJC00_00495 [Dysgonomonas sp. OttesenSCG-928-M03]|nr:hypothetical protein [Dysgonomonas sp. OttesenSCG-928-M03]